MTDVYECEGQMSIYEFLDKEPHSFPTRRSSDLALYLSIGLA